MVENKNEQELKCYQCNKIYTTTLFLKECSHHFCEECIYFWLSNSFSDYLFENNSNCSEKLSYKNNSLKINKFKIN
jgi:hypothetical protein